MRFILLFIFLNTVFSRPLPLTVMKWGANNLSLLENPEEVLIERLIYYLRNQKTTIYQYPYKDLGNRKHALPQCDADTLEYKAKRAGVSSPLQLYAYYECLAADNNIPIEATPGFQQYLGRKLALAIHIKRRIIEDSLNYHKKKEEKLRRHIWTSWAISKQCISEYAQLVFNHRQETCSTTPVQYLPGINSTPEERDKSIILANQLFNKSNLPEKDRKIFINSYLFYGRIYKKESKNDSSN